MKYKLLITLFLGCLFLGFDTTNVVAVKESISNRNYNGKTLDFEQGNLHYEILNYKILDDPLPSPDNEDYSRLQRYLVCTVKLTNKKATSTEVLAYDFMGWSGPNDIYATKKPEKYKNPEGVITLDADSSDEKDSTKIVPGESKTFAFFYIVYPDDDLNITVNGLNGTLENISLKKTVSSNGIVAD